jgi:hypothetical protein
VIRLTLLSVPWHSVLNGATEKSSDPKLRATQCPGARVRIDARYFLPTDVRFGLLADITRRSDHLGFASDSRAITGRHRCVRAPHLTLSDNVNPAISLRRRKHALISAFTSKPDSPDTLSTDNLA